MKKIIIIVVFIAVLLYQFKNNEYNSIDNSIRFRVIANSNSSRDILMKEKVVKELSNILFKDNNSFEEAEKNIYDNLNNIENRIENVFKSNSYNKNFNINYGLNEIPTKYYNGKKYEKGLYKSLVIEIGEGKGNNYFCILYPSLCLLNNDEVSEKDEYKSKIIDIFSNIFK